MTQNTINFSSEQARLHKGGVRTNWLYSCFLAIVQKTGVCPNKLVRKEISDVYQHDVIDLCIRAHVPMIFANTFNDNRLRREACPHLGFPTVSKTPW